MLRRAQKRCVPLPPVYCRRGKPEPALRVQVPTPGTGISAMPNCRNALLTASLVVLTIGAAQGAENVPDFDVGPTCRGATRPEAALRDQSGEALREACVNQENQARDDLRGKWAGFPADHRASCIKTTTVGGIPSYVQLQTCLETRRDAGRIEDRRNNGATTTTGQDAISR